MTPEAWVTILAATAAVLLGATAVAGATARIRSARRNDLLAATGRGATLIVLAVAIALAASLDGSPSLADVRLVATSLVLSATAVHLALTVASRQRAALWPVDALLSGLLALALLLAGGAVAADCAQHAFLFFLAWALYLFGGGALLVAGGAGATALRTASNEHAPQERQAQQVVRVALPMSLLTVGAGLLVDAWWAWQTTGKVVGSDQRQVWMAVAWVVTAMALAARELEKRQDRWVAALAATAAAVTIFGLLILPRLANLWGG